ncbi:MAG: TRAP transporter small permease [Lachnospiraceae bacterium]|nr:TRAP transporter small permease [Lachnospiraceae bacterium]
MVSFFEKVDKLRPVYDITYRIVLFICKILLIGDILITSYSVLGRYISFIPDPAWTEEIVLTFMSYMAVLSAALAIRKKSHIRMTAFDKYLPEAALKALDILADVAVFVLAVIMITTGWQFATTIGGRGTYVSIPTLSRFWKYFPIPVAGVAMLLFEIEALYGHIKGIFIKEGKEETK